MGEHVDDRQALLGALDAVFGPDGYDRLADSRRTQLVDNLTSVKAELLGSGFMPLIASRVRNGQVPTLLIGGQRSIGLFHPLTDRLEELLPAGERIEIPGASHMMHEDNTAACNAAIGAFLERYRRVR